MKASRAWFTAAGLRAGTPGIRRPVTRACGMGKRRRCSSAVSAACCCHSRKSVPRVSATRESCHRAEDHGHWHARSHHGHHRSARHRLLRRLKRRLSSRAHDGHCGRVLHSDCETGGMTSFRSQARWPPVYGRLQISDSEVDGFELQSPAACAARAVGRHPRRGTGGTSCGHLSQVVAWRG